MSDWLSYVIELFGNVWIWSGVEDEPQRFVGG